MTSERFTTRSWPSWLVGENMNRLEDQGTRFSGTPLKQPNYLIALTLWDLPVSDNISIPATKQMTQVKPSAGALKPDRKGVTHNG